MSPRSFSKTASIAVTSGFGFVSAMVLPIGKTTFGRRQLNSTSQRNNSTLTLVVRERTARIEREHGGVDRDVALPGPGCRAGELAADDKMLGRVFAQRRAVKGHEVGFDGGDDAVLWMVRDDCEARV